MMLLPIRTLSQLSIFLPKRWDDESFDTRYQGKFLVKCKIGILEPHAWARCKHFADYVRYNRFSVTAALCFEHNSQQTK